MAGPAPSLDPLKKALSKSKSRARIEDVAEGLTTAFGGVHSLCDIFVKEFRDGKPGGMGRARLLGDYVRLLSLTSKRDQSTPISDMTDAELEDEAKIVMDRYLQATPIVVPKEAPVEPPPPVNS